MPIYNNPILVSLSKMSNDFTKYAIYKNKEHELDIYRTKQLGIMTTKNAISTQLKTIAIKSGTDMKTYNKEIDKEKQNFIANIPNYWKDEGLAYFDVEVNKNRSYINKLYNEEQNRLYSLSATELLENNKVDILQLSYNATSEDDYRDLNFKIAEYNNSIIEGVKLKGITITQAKNYSNEIKQGAITQGIMGKFDRLPTYEDKEKMYNEILSKKGQIPNLTPDKVQGIANKMRTSLNKEKETKEVNTLAEKDLFKYVIKSKKKGLPVSIEDDNLALSIASSDDNKMNELSNANLQNNFIEYFNTLPIKEQRETFDMYKKELKNYPMKEVLPTLEQHLVKNLNSLENDPVSLIKNVIPITSINIGDPFAIKERIDQVQMISYREYGNIDYINTFLTQDESTGINDIINHGTQTQINNLLINIDQWGEKRTELINSLYRNNYQDGFKIDLYMNMNTDILNTILSGKDIKLDKSAEEDLKFDYEQSDIYDNLNSIYGNDGAVVMENFILSYIKGSRIKIDPDDAFEIINGNRKIVSFKGELIEAPYAGFNARETTDFFRSLTPEDIEISGGIDNYSNSILPDESRRYSFFGTKYTNNISEATELLNSSDIISHTLGNGKYYWTDNNGDIIYNDDGNVFIINYEKLRK
jgi:hypothetical protein